jgi:hypothetical protein
MLPTGVKQIQLSNSSDADTVTNTQNVVNVMTPIIRFTATRGREFYIPGSNEANGREYPGMFAVIDLRDSAGNKLPPSAKLEFAAKNPTDESKRIIRTIQHTIFNALSAKDQQSKDFKERVQDALNLPDGGSAVLIDQQGEFVVSLESAVQVDWTKSSFVLWAGEMAPGTSARLRAGLL